MQHNKAGVLYVVATPVGNLGDITARALSVLSSVDVVAAEDTRHTRKLLSHHGIDAKLMALHEHNEAQQSMSLLQQCLAGRQIALVSDAGTPLISDPGQELVQKAYELGVNLVSIPGPCAAIAALSVSGLSADRFVFEGFLPARPARRQKRLEQLLIEARTMVFYEAVHRMPAFLQELVATFGKDRLATVARELTKKFETVVRATLVELSIYFTEHPDQLRGEFVVLVSGTEEQRLHPVLSPKVVLQHLLAELPPSKAAAVAAKLLGESKKTLYALALELQQN